MKFIIDTHVLIWYIEGIQKISQETIDIIKNTGNEMLVSKASLWEMAIKINLGKLDLSLPFEAIEPFLIHHHFKIFDFDFRHLKNLVDLPYLHGDPFDRLIIAQAITENLTIITYDQSFEDYPIKIQK